MWGTQSTTKTWVCQCQEHLDSDNDGVCTDGSYDPIPAIRVKPVILESLRGHWCARWPTWPDCLQNNVFYRFCSITIGGQGAQNSFHSSWELLFFFFYCLAKMFLWHFFRQNFDRVTVNLRALCFFRQQFCIGAVNSYVFLLLDGRQIYLGAASWNVSCFLSPTILRWRRQHGQKPSQKTMFTIIQCSCQNETAWGARTYPKETSVMKSWEVDLMWWIGPRKSVSQSNLYLPIFCLTNNIVICTCWFSAKTTTSILNSWMMTFF